ncbi:MAG: hypothetical protein ACE5D3_03830 [Candidatus Binatia bacterium]
MMAVVILRPNTKGRYYRLPSEQDHKAVWKAQKRVAAVLEKWERDGKEGVS